MKQKLTNKKISNKIIAITAVDELPMSICVVCSFSNGIQIMSFRIFFNAVKMIGKTWIGLLNIG